MGIPYEEDQNLVRGLDYYTHTVFEISDSSLGSQDALGAGGRYNKLISQLGGPEVDAIGFALGIERILLAMGKQEESEPCLDYYFVTSNELTLRAVFQLMSVLRDQDSSCDTDYRLGSMKSQMRQANKFGAKYVVILGEEELGKGQVAVKKMEDGQQLNININEFKDKDKRNQLLSTKC